MDSSSNGSLSNGNTKKRPSENGCCPSSSGVLFKYKTRKVSAVRDFPPGCGRNAQWINSRPQETAAALVVADKATDVVEADGVKVSEIGVESISHEAVKSPVQVEMADSLDNLVANVVATTGTVSGVEKLPSDVESLGNELPKGLANNTLELSKESDGVNVKALVKEELLEGEVQNLVKESSSHELEILTMVKTVGAPKNKTVLEVGALADVAVPMGSEKLWSPPQCSTTDANVPVGSGPMNKYPLRRVSATRDFPPFCGSNAPPPTEEDRLRVSGKKSLVVVEKVGVGSVVLGETFRAGVEGGTSRGTVRAGGEESEGNARDGNVQKSESKDIVSEPRTKTHVRDGNVQKSEPKDVVPEPRKKTHVRDGNVQMSESREIVPEPRKKTHVREGNDQKSESREIVPESRKKTHDRDGNFQKSESKEIVSEPRKKTRTVMQRSNKDVGGPVGKVGKEIVLYSPDNDLKRKPLGDAAGLGQDMDRVIVQCLMAAPNCPWRQGRGAVTSPDDVMSRRKVKKRDFNGQEKSKVGASMNSHEANKSVVKSTKEKSKSAGKATYGGVGDLVVKDEEDYVVHDEEQNEDSPAGRRSSDFSVSLPPFGPNSSNQGDARNRVRETLRLFQAICRKLLQGEEAKLRKGEEAKSRKGEEVRSKQPLRIDLVAAKIVRDKGKELNSGKQMLGAVPGVEVGDEFQYRVELAIVGIHRLYQAGIDYIKQGKKIVAASIVASGGYNDELDSADVLIYSGQGGNAAGRDKKAEDQKLERGNLALKNCIEARNPVRVIRGSKETKASDSSDTKAKLVATYVYDGLYMVEKYWQEVGVHGKLVFKFELRRIPGQPELAWKELKKSRKFKTREGLCVNDISGGKELFPICAVNTIDNDEPPQFNYITRMIYPDQFLPVPPDGCDCTGVCMDSHTCSCAVKNGGEIPYNYNGAIVEAKPLVYECGPSCKCPPSCHNRVSQHGIKIHLEIFKTDSRGWGVRSINSIPSGSFICEYIGELLEDKEAEQRTGNDEYLFDIGQNYNDCSHKPDEQSSSSEVVEDGGFTIDAAQFGNVGRFINHSCSPNLYAQNVLYDHVDRRIPHIMFFSAENIPPLQELTYHYNYSVDQVRDSNGNIKMKNCYCGSTECTGRMY